MIQFDFTKKDDGRDWFMFKINREKLRTDGFKALCVFLNKLHVLKSIGD